MINLWKMGKSFRIWFQLKPSNQSRLLFFTLTTIFVIIKIDITTIKCSACIASDKCFQELCQVWNGHTEKIFTKFSSYSAVFSCIYWNETKLDSKTSEFKTTCWLHSRCSWMELLRARTESLLVVVISKMNAKDKTCIFHISWIQSNYLKFKLFNELLFISQSKFGSICHEQK